MTLSDLKNNPKLGIIVIAIALFISSKYEAYGQTATEILKYSIQYHDPNSVWQRFKGELNITMESPDGRGRNSRVSINRQNGHFEMSVKKGDALIKRTLKDENCEIKLNGDSVFTDGDKVKYGLTCERSKMYRNYYTYLYGMPMKIKDDGARLNSAAEKVSFMGKSYWKLQVTYDESVGRDTWYFYFNSETYAMEAYQFYHNEEANDGEYILLTEEIDYRGMKIPKVRKWYMNTDDKYLGVDILNTVKSL